MTPNRPGHTSKDDHVFANVYLLLAVSIYDINRRFTDVHWVTPQARSDFSSESVALFKTWFRKACSDYLFSTFPYGKIFVINFSSCSKVFLWEESVWSKALRTLGGVWIKSLDSSRIYILFLTPRCGVCENETVQVVYRRDLVLGTTHSYHRPRFFTHSQQFLSCSSRAVKERIAWTFLNKTHLLCAFL